MSRPLHRLSTILFFLLAGSFFVGYLLARDALLLPWSQWWLKVADLPLALAALLYGGTSFYMSLKRREGTSWVLFLMIAIPLVALFLLLVTLNFWTVIGLPQGVAA